MEKRKLRLKTLNAVTIKFCRKRLDQVAHCYFSTYQEPDYKYTIFPENIHIGPQEVHALLHRQQQLPLNAKASRKQKIGTFDKCVQVLEQIISEFKYIIMSLGTKFLKIKFLSVFLQ